MNNEETKPILDQEMTTVPDQVEQEEINFNRPSLLARLKSMLADSVVIIILMMIASSILNALDIESGLVRGIALGLVFLYEPIMVAIDRTIGQRIIGLRVRNYSKFINESNHQNINIFYSLIRYVGKILLGWVSLLTIHSNPYGQAIHDKIGNSMMIFE